MEFSLNARERSALEGLVSGSKDVRQLKRAQALLAVAAGEAVTDVARRLQVARNTIYNWMARVQDRAGALRRSLVRAVGLAVRAPAELERPQPGADLGDDRARVPVRDLELLTGRQHGGNHTARRRRPGHGARRTTRQRLSAPRSKHSRSCIRFGRPCQNSARSTSIRHPPQCGGTGMISSSANRRSIPASAASRLARSATTLDWAEAHAPSCEPRGRTLK